VVSLSADFIVSTNRTHVQKMRLFSASQGEGVALNIASSRPVASPFLFRGIFEVTFAHPGWDKRDLATRLWRYVTLITSRSAAPVLDLSAIRGIRGRDVDDFEALINDARRRESG